MEGNNLPSGSLMQGTPYSNVDLQHHKHMQMPAPSSGNQAFNYSQVPGNFPICLNQVTDSDQLPEFQFGEHGKVSHHHHPHHHKQHATNSMSDDEEHGVHEDATDSQIGKGKKGNTWHRMKWTDSMVRLLITAASYTGEDPGADLGGGRRSCAMMQKKGKWKAISKVMGERGCLVSPQQCEDKFNDLNKRYKRLTDILGRGTTCRVVANPELLDGMANLSDKMKDDARKILSSKHLFYEEMCSYHNNNRFSLPEDPALQRSLQLALKCKDEHDARKRASGDADEDDQSADTDYEEENDDEHPITHANKGTLLTHKRLRYMPADMEDVGFGNSSSSHDCSWRSDPHSIAVDINKASPADRTNLASVQKDLATQSAEIEKQRMEIEVEALELAKQRLKWEAFSKKKDRELEKMRLENEQMKIENKRLELEVRYKELELEHKPQGHGSHAT